VSVVLRDLAPADLPWVADREREIFGRSAWSKDLIEHDFELGFSRYRGAERGGELVAYAVYGFEGEAFHLMNLAVAPSARRHGVARALVEDFLAQAHAVGAAEVWLEVAVDNAPAIALYASYGFTQVRIRPRYYQPEDVDAAVMRLQLGDSPAQGQQPRHG
jgi:ribosomal-protein-alanine N-acetyltransferase